MRAKIRWHFPPSDITVFNFVYSLNFFLVVRNGTLGRFGYFSDVIKLFSSLGSTAVTDELSRSVPEGSADGEAL